MLEYQAFKHLLTEQKRPKRVIKKKRGGICADSLFLWGSENPLAVEIIRTG